MLLNGRTATNLGSHGADVLGFLALAARADLELDGLALGQSRTGDLKVGDVDEHVLAVLPGDETEASVLIEELHFALHNVTNCLSRPIKTVDRHCTVRAVEARSSFCDSRPTRIRWQAPTVGCAIGEDRRVSDSRVLFTC
jgi:hypothetical protein